MSRIQPYAKYVLNLEGKFSEEYLMLYMPKEKAYKALKDTTGQDFGYDAAAWREWFQENGIDLER